MSNNYIQVGSVPAFGPGAQPQTGGPQGDAYVSEWHGNRAAATRAGKLFHGCGVVAGNAFPIYTTTAPLFCLWNTGPNNVELVRFTAGYVSGTTVAGPYGYQFIPNCAAAGNGATGGQYLTAFNSVPKAVIPGLIGSGAASTCLFSNAATNTITSAGEAIAIVNYIPGNMSTQIIESSATAGTTVIEEVFNGDIIIPPNTFFYPVGLVASVGLFNMRLTWIETPVTTGY